MIKYCRTDQLVIWLENKINTNQEEISLLTVLSDLEKGNVPETDVIPTDFVRKWFKEHYHTNANGLINDYKNNEKVSF